jgi:hypothetical protein
MTVYEMYLLREAMDAVTAVWDRADGEFTALRAFQLLKDDSHVFDDIDIQHDAGPRDLSANAVSRLTQIAASVRDGIDLGIEGPAAVDGDSLARWKANATLLAEAHSGR